MSKRSKSKKSPAQAEAITKSIPPAASQAATWEFPWIKLLQALVIILSATWIYFPILHGGWLMDDNAYVTQNPGLRDPYGPLNMWFAPGSFVEYYPIEETLLWIIWQFWQDDSFGYHVVTLICHIAGSLLVWYFFSKFKLRFAWLAGLVFAVHPVQVESVAWVAELKNTLSLPPFLLAMCWWIDFENKSRKSEYFWVENKDTEHNRPIYYFLALGFFLIAMLCKITMAPFPVVMLVYAWWKRGAFGFKDIVNSLPFFVISVALGLTTLFVGDWYAPGHVLAIKIPIGDFWSRLACGGLSIAFYFFQVFLPIQMLPAYPQWKIDPPTLQQFLPWPIMLGIFCWLWYRRNTWGRHVLLGLAFFLLILAPFIGFKGVSYMRFTWVMDHFLYLPILGLLGIAIAGIEMIDNRIPASYRTVLMGVLTVLVATLTIESHNYAGKFFNLETVWTYEIKYNPSAWLAHNNLGYIMVEQNRLDEAAEQFREALAIKPDYSEAHNNLGVVYSRTGHLDEAIEQYQAALEVNPDYGDAANNLEKLKAVKAQREHAAGSPPVFSN